MKLKRHYHRYTEEEILIVMEEYGRGNNDRESVARKAKISINSVSKIVYKYNLAIGKGGNFKEIEPWQIEQMKDWYKIGVSTPLIGKYLGFSQPFVCLTLFKNGVQPHRKSPSEINRLIEKGMKNGI